MNSRILKYTNFVFVFFVIFIIGCSKKDENGSRYKNINLQSDRVIAKKVVDLNKSLGIDQNLTMYDSKNGKMIISGAVEQEILNGFALAISQVIIEEGVSIPDCTSLAKTGYLTKEDCDKVSSKYFGFYDFDDNGNIQKVDDIFYAGVVGDEIDIRSAEIEYFDSSNNPLLGDFVKFKDFVDYSGDITLLKSFKNLIPANKLEMQKILDKKIEMLARFEVNENEVLNRNNLTTVKLPEDVKKEKAVVGVADNSNIDSQTKQQKNISYSLLSSQLALLKSQHDNTAALLAKDPSNQQLIEQYSRESQQIASLQSQLSSLQ